MTKVFQNIIFLHLFSALNVTNKVYAIVQEVYDILKERNPEQAAKIYSSTSKRKCETTNVEGAQPLQKKLAIKTELDTNTLEARLKAQANQITLLQERILEVTNLLKAAPMPPTVYLDLYMAEEFEYIQESTIVNTIPSQLLQFGIWRSATS